MSLLWKRHECDGWFGFNGRDGNAIAVLDKRDAGEWKLTVRDDVNDMRLTIRRTKSTVVGTFTDLDEAKATADVYYRMVKNVITS